MATTTASRTTLLILALAAAPCAARGAAAQSIRVGAVVTAPAGLMSVHSDTAIPAPPIGTQRIRIADVGRLDIQTGEGAAVRVAPSFITQPDTTRRIRVTIDYVGN